MTTVRELTEPYGSFLIHPRSPAQGVCATCRSAVSETYQRCFQCNKAVRAAGDRLADTVVPISIAVKRDQLAVELWRYKNQADETARRVLLLRLAAVLWRFLDKHEHCVAKAAGVTEFDLVTTVPSTSGRGDHPLRRIVGSVVGSTQDRYVDLLMPNSSAPQDRDVRRDRFSLYPDEDITGAAILLIDDTWTQGGHAQSAAWTLKYSGASRVGVVVIGRHFDPAFADSSAYLRSARKVRFSWDFCCVHDAGT